MIVICVENAQGEAIYISMNINPANMVVSKTQTLISADINELTAADTMGWVNQSDIYIWISFTNSLLHKVQISRIRLTYKYA